MEVFDQITLESSKLFLKYGLRSVSMDDIARTLTISKKTLYQHFAKKEDLITATMNAHFNQEVARCEQILSEHDNPIEELVAIGLYVREYFKSINPTAVYDLQKYYPLLWKVLEKKRSAFIYSIIIDNIEKGVAQGFFRDDFNPQVVTRFYITRMNAMMDPKLFPSEEFTWSEIYLEGLNYHIHGIASEKGNEHFKALISTIKEKQNAY